MQAEIYTLCDEGCGDKYEYKAASPQEAIKQHVKKGSYVIDKNDPCKYAVLVVYVDEDDRWEAKLNRTESLLEVAQGYGNFPGARQ